MASNIQIEIAADVQKAVQGIEAVVQRLDKMQDSAEKNKKSFTSFTASFALFSSALNTVSSYVSTFISAVGNLTEAYSAQELAERKLQTTLKATQNVVGMSAGELFDYADSLSQVTTYSNQEIIAAEQMLASVRMIGHEVMPEATRAVLDMAAATGEDLTGAAQRLAQALADPAGEIESLKEAGIQLTEEQKKNIEKAQDQNDIYKAQKLLLEQVSNTYGGMAEAIADTDTGKLRQISNVWSDIKEGLGQGLLDRISPALDALYDRLVDISDWVEESNRKASGQRSLVDFARMGNAGRSSFDYSTLSESDIENMLLGSRYYNLSDEDKAAFDPSIPATRKGIAAYEQELVEAYLIPELNTIDRVNKAMESVAEKISGMEDPGEYIRNLYDTASRSAESGDSYSRRYASALAEEYDGYLSPSTQTGPDVGAYIEENSSLSRLFQLDEISKELEEARAMMKEATADQVPYVQEIIASLEDEREKILELKDATEEVVPAWQQSLKDMMPSINEAVDYAQDALSSFTDLFTQLMENEVNAVEQALDECTSKWDEYLSDLDEKQTRMRESLNAQLAAGLVSQDEYVSAMEELDEEEMASKKAAQEEEESLQKKRDELKKKQFEADKANNIANALVNGALAITRIWSENNWMVATALTAVSAGITAAQVATIASQQYTPMAAGGITTGPTHALIGEAGYQEMVLPLTDSNLQKVGLGSQRSGDGTIVININVGTAYNGEQLAEDVYKGIERAQRTGALPKWRYA